MSKLPTVKQQNAAKARRAERLANPDEKFAADVAAGHEETDIEAWAVRVDTRNHRTKKPSTITIRRTGGTG